MCILGLKSHWKSCIKSFNCSTHCLDLEDFGADLGFDRDILVNPSEPCQFTIKHYISPWICSNCCNIKSALYEINHCAIDKTLKSPIFCVNLLSKGYWHEITRYEAGDSTIWRWDRVVFGGILLWLCHMYAFRTRRFANTISVSKNINFPSFLLGILFRYH